MTFGIILSLGSGLSKVAGKVFRIGHLGSVSNLMLFQGLARAEMALRDLGILVEAGSGVAAAREYYRKTARPVELESAAAATV